MKVIKKIVSLFIVIIMTISLAACGNSGQSETDGTEQLKLSRNFREQILTAIVLMNHCSVKMR